MQLAGNRQDGGWNFPRPTAGRADGPISFVLLDPPSNPSEHKLLTPTPSPPPPKKGYPVSGDRGLKIQKSICGSLYWPK